MATAAGTVELLALELGRALEPLKIRLESGQAALELFARLGLNFPADLLNHEGFAGALGTSAARALELPQRVARLAGAAEAEGADTGEVLSAAAALIETIEELVSALRTLGTALDQLNSENLLPGMDADAVRAFAERLAERLVEFMLLEYLEGYYPISLQALALLGLVELKFEQTDSTDPTKPAYLSKRLCLERLENLLTSPADAFESVYGWGAPDFKGQYLLERLDGLLHAFALPSALMLPTAEGVPPELHMLLLTLRPKVDGLPLPGLEALLELGLTGGQTWSMPFVSEGWTLEFRAEGDLKAGAGIVLEPPAKLTFVPPGGEVAGALRVALRGQHLDDPPRPFRLLSHSGGSRIEADRLTLGAGVDFDWNSATLAADGKVSFEGRVEGGSVVLTFGDADSFLRSIMPGEGLELKFDLTAGWSEERGLYFSGGGKLETTIPLNVALGPLTLAALHIALVAGAEGVGLETSISGGFVLGPVSLSVERVGISAALEFKDEALGLFNLDLGFKPPSGLGLLLDGGVVTGGGFISYDHADGRYAGVLQLEVKGISLKAVGLLETSLPGGAEGYSLLVVITAEGFPPIQLGYGFTLQAVGGLLGINRTGVVEQMRAGLKSGLLDSLLFPADPVGNAAQYTSDLQSVFPPADGRHVFGPMVIIGWGSPTILTLELALLLELPSPVRLAAVGRLSAALPSLGAAVLRLQMDAVGAIDFEMGEAALDATLRDSYLATFPLTGEMAMRASWAATPNFLLSVGGFHPQYQPPSDFPQLPRLTLNLASSPNPRLRLEAYLALTSNTAQFGAYLDLYAEEAGFSLRGEFRFDTLFQLTPLAFTAGLRGWVAIKCNGVDILTAQTDVRLSGPAPWYAVGGATFEYLGISTTVDFEWRVGSAAQIPAPAPVDLLGLLKAAIEDARNWDAQIPGDGHGLVSLGGGARAAQGVLVHPSGELTFRQRVLPLNVEVEQYGNSPVSGERYFGLFALVGETKMQPAAVTDYFAPAQFLQLSDTDKLSRPAFELMDAGLTFRADAVSYRDAVPVQMSYETFIFDPNLSVSAKLADYPVLSETLGGMTGYSAAARSPIRRTGTSKYSTPGAGAYAVGETTYVAATVEDQKLKEIEGIDSQTGTSYTEAEDALRSYLAGHPEEEGTLQVVGIHEAA